MTKIVAVILILLVGGIFLIKSSNLQKPKQPLEPKPISEESMSEEKARSIAEKSECVEDGALKDKAFYNKNSKTWWIDLEIDKPGCSPACVVYEDGEVEINWRCTGLNP